MKLYSTILFVLLYLNAGYAQDKILEYKGKEIDFSFYPVATLYKGDNKQLVAAQLNNEGIHNHVRKEQNIWYIELEFDINKEIKDGEDIWIQLKTNINAAEIYLNRELLLKNGVIGTSYQTEKGGKNLVRTRIPKHLIRYGINNISVKFSNFRHQNAGIFKDLSIGSFKSFQRHSMIMSVAPFLFAGIFLFALLVNIALYFSLNRKKVFLLLATLFLSSFLMMTYEFLYWNGLLPAVSFIHNFTETGWFEYFIYFLLSLAIIFEYDFKKLTILLVVILFILISIGISINFLSTSLYFSLIPLGFSVWALLKKKGNAILITISLIILSIFIFLDDYDVVEGYDFVRENYIITSFIYKLDSLGLVLFALTMVFTSSKGILHKTNALNKAKLKLERLEYKFLQKHIQPHFLMNSLMSLQQLVSKDPENAGKMIEALSEEFHLLTLMSKKKMVPIQQEIDMCKTHLQIMSIQQKARYRMTVKGINGTEMIPPAVIHTLVENGITHGYSGNEDAYFELTKTETDTQIRYRLFNDGNLKTFSEKHATSGTGLKYIEARLEENYPGRWTLHSNQVENGWEAIIEIDKKL